MGSLGSRDGRALPQFRRACGTRAGPAVRYGGRSTLNRAPATHSSYLLRQPKRKPVERLFRRLTVTSQETIYRQIQRLP
ncbi:hypothetical protein DF047_15085 [Burkholderia cenocepacia]|nr:hypothetical protein DF047_15085 [Burkholderia cenocepacia]